MSYVLTIVSLLFIVITYFTMSKKDTESFIGDLELYKTSKKNIRLYHRDLKRKAEGKIENINGTLRRFLRKRF